MRLIFEGPVARDMKSVYAEFNEKLFLALAPIVPPMKLIRFDGSRVGDLVQLEIGVRPFIQHWTSEITSEYQNDSECTFVDEGVVLPFPLTKWRHVHRVVKTGENACKIIDEIEYQTFNKLFDWALYPIFYAQFCGRPKKYRRFFCVS